LDRLRNSVVKRPVITSTASPRYHFHLVLSSRLQTIPELRRHLFRPSPDQSFHQWKSKRHAFSVSATSSLTQLLKPRARNATTSSSENVPVAEISQGMPRNSRLVARNVGWSQGNRHTKDVLRVQVQEHCISGNAKTNPSVSTAPRRNPKTQQGIPIAPETGAEAETETVGHSSRVTREENKYEPLYSRKSPLPTPLPARESTRSTRG